MRTRPKRSPSWPVLPILVLGSLSAAYLSLALVTLVWNIGQSFPIDLRLRWTESRLLLEGINPQVAGHPDAELSGAHEVMKTLGGSYPPWAYATGLLLVPPVAWPVVRWYSAILNAASLTVLAWWAYGQVRRCGGTWGWTSAVAALAMFPMAICVSYGQYSVIVAACLAGVDRLIDARTTPRAAAAGLLLGIACVKPQLAGLFVLALFVERQWVTVMACLSYLAVASGVAWLLAGSDPITMFIRSTKEASAFSFLSHNVLVRWMGDVLPFQTASLVLALMGAGVALTLLFRARTRSRLIRWSICAIVAMFWTYRKHYDVPLMVFPLTGLLLMALTDRRRVLWVAYAVLGLTVWLPIRDDQWTLPIVQIADLVVWVTGLGFLLSRAKVPIERASA